MATTQSDAAGRRRTEPADYKPHRFGVVIWARDSVWDTNGSADLTLAIAIVRKLGNGELAGTDGVSVEALDAEA